MLFYVAFTLLPNEWHVWTSGQARTISKIFTRKRDHSSRYQKGHTEFHSVNSAFLWPCFQRPHCCVFIELIYQINLKSKYTLRGTATILILRSVFWGRADKSKGQFSFLLSLKQTGSFAGHIWGGSASIGSILSVPRTLADIEHSSDGVVGF